MITGSGRFIGESHNLPQKTSLAARVERGEFSRIATAN